MATKKAKAPTDPKYQALAEEAVRESGSRPDFGYSGGLPIGKTWGFTFAKHRDSGLLEQSNYEVIKKDLEERFSEDVQSEHFGHWAVGWIDELAVRMLDKKGKITAAGMAALEWQEKLADYPVADEEDYSERQTEATIENIMSEGRIDRDKAGEVYGWLWDNNERALQDSDDQGGYPYRDQIEKALRGLGYIQDEETGEWGNPPPPPPPYQDPSQLKLPGMGAKRPIHTSKLRNPSFPRLTHLIEEGVIVAKDGEYVGKDRDGEEVSIGTVGYETAAENYLQHHPTPNTW